MRTASMKTEGSLLLLVAGLGGIASGGGEATGAWNGAQKRAAEEHRHGNDEWGL